jgi:hypothetical protein
MRFSFASTKMALAAALALTLPAKAIDTQGFTLDVTDGWPGNLELLSDSGNAASFVVHNFGLWESPFQAKGVHDLDGDDWYDELGIGVRAGYKITGITLSTQMTGSLSLDWPGATASSTVKFHMRAYTPDFHTLAEQSAEYHNVDGSLLGSASIHSDALTGNFVLYVDGTEFVQESGGEANLLLTNPTLTITYAAAVPEPSRWSMLLGGMILTAAVARRRRNR